MSTVLDTPPGRPASPAPGDALPRRVQGGLLDPAQLLRSLPDAVRKLTPVTLYTNPVMLIVEIGSGYTTVLAVRDPTAFAILIAVWLWLTVVFANLAEAVAEGADEFELGKVVADATVLRVPLAVVRPEGVDVAALYGAPMTLVRPDQHVAWRGDRWTGALARAVGAREPAEAA